MVFFFVLEYIIMYLYICFLVWKEMFSQIWCSIIACKLMYGEIYYTMRCTVYYITELPFRFKPDIIIFWQFKRYLHVSGKRYWGFYAIKSMFGTTLDASQTVTPNLANYQKIEEYSEITRDLVLNTIFNIFIIYLVNFKHDNTCY